MCFAVKNKRTGTYMARRINNSIKGTVRNFDMWRQRGKLQQIMFLHENRKRSFDHAAEVFFSDEVLPCRSFRRIICKYGNFAFCRASLAADTTITPRRKNDSLIQPHWAI